GTAHVPHRGPPSGRRTPRRRPSGHTRPSRGRSPRTQPRTHRRQATGPPVSLAGRPPQPQAPGADALGQAIPTSLRTFDELLGGNPVGRTRAFYPTCPARTVPAATVQPLTAGHVG